MSTCSKWIRVTIFSTGDNQFQILHSYTLLLKLPILMHSRYHLMYLAKRNSYMVTSTKTLRYAHKIECFYVYVCSVIITIHNTNDRLNEFNWMGSMLLISYILITCIKPTDSKFIAQRQLQTPQEDQWLTKHVLVQTVKRYSSIRKNLEPRSVFTIYGKSMRHTHTGLQAMEGVHHCPGSNELHLSRLLEDGLWERVWGDCDVVRPGGEWKGLRDLYRLTCFTMIVEHSPVCKWQETGQGPGNEATAVLRL